MWLDDNAADNAYYTGYAILCVAYPILNSLSAMLVIGIAAQILSLLINCLGFSFTLSTRNLPRDYIKTSPMPLLGQRSNS